MVTTLLAIDTFNRQLAAAQASGPPAQVVREETYFRENIANITTPEELLADFRLYRYVMTAYDLAEAIDSRAIVQRVLEEGSDDAEDLAVRLNDPRFQRLTDELGFAVAGNLKLLLPNFIDQVAAQYQRVALEQEAGETNNAVRLAAYFDRQITEASGWFAVLVDPPLREVVFTALQIPQAFQTLDPDRLVEELEERYAFADFQDTEKRQEFITRFAIFTDIAAGPSATVPASAALALLTPPAGPATPGEGLSLFV